jgi:DNA-binding Lrp family transcriptional regulator
MKNSNIKKLVELLKSPTIEEVVPPGWTNTKELAKELNLSESAAFRRIKMLISSGRIEIRKFKINAGATVRPVPHYKLK